MSSQLRLSEFSVLITRPAAQQQELSQALKNAGARPVAMPLLKIEALPPSASLRQKIQQLDNYDILIFISSNAAALGARQIDDYWPQFPVAVTVAAIGPSTARTLEQLLQCEVVHSRSGVTSEDLLRLPEFSQLKNKKIALFRGRGGRELLPRILTERGALVDTIELYQRKNIAYTNSQLKQILDDNAVNIIVISSGEALSRLCQLSGNNKSEVGLIPLLVPSERVRQQAQAEGFQKVINCKGADSESVLAGLHELASKQ